MTVTSVVPGVYMISIGIVNAFLIDAGDLLLIDTGIPGSANKILAAVRSLGRQPGDLRHILVTHLHADHSGSLATLKAATGAAAYMHPADAAMVQSGQAARPFRLAPGLPALLLRPLVRPNQPAAVEAAAIEHEVVDGQELPLAGGLLAIHTPGHSAGHLAFLWPHQGGVLFAADAASHMVGRLGLSFVYEDLEQGWHSLAKLAGLEFATACFGHGRPITSAAAARFRHLWPIARATQPAGPAI